MNRCIALQSRVACLLISRSGLHQRSIGLNPIYLKKTSNVCQNVNQTAFYSKKKTPFNRPVLIVGIMSALFVLAITAELSVNRRVREENARKAIEGRKHE